MRFFRPIKSIMGYLERIEIFSCQKFSIRIHKILSNDCTNTIHTHPFNYFSIVLWGNYLEMTENGERKRGLFSFKYGHHTEYHQIKHCDFCLTLFITFGKFNWSLKHINGFKPSRKNGLYFHNNQYIKFNDFWFIGHEDKKLALMETRYSIYQDRQDLKFLGELNEI